MLQSGSRGGSAARAAERRPNQRPKQRRHLVRFAQLLLEPLQLDLNRDHGRMRSSHRFVEELQAVLDRHRDEPLTAHPLKIRGAQVGGHADALLRPQAPGQAGAGKALPATMRDQRIEERVGRRVARLPGAPHHPRRRREQHERGQVVALRQLVQVPRAVDLRPQHRREPIRRQRRHHAVVEHPGEMVHAGERALLRYGFDHRGECRAIRRIARHDAHRRGAEIPQRGDEFRGARRVHAAARRQQNMPHPVHRHQVPAQRLADLAQPSGHQDGALPAKRPRRLQDQLPDMAGLRHVPVRRRRVPKVVSLHGKR